MAEKIDGIVLVPEPSREYLNSHQLVDYREHRRQLVQWALKLGKVDGGRNRRTWYNEPLADYSVVAWRLLDDRKPELLD